MHIDWNSFTPWTSLAGGALIGLAAAMFACLNGRIAGISGILAGIIPPRPYDFAWRLVFVLGMLAAPLLAGAFGFLPAAQIDANALSLVIAGLLVGAGTRAAGGCTSGHGVCGIARLSPRSLAATGCFMLAGFLVVYALRHLPVGGAA